MRLFGLWVLCPILCACADDPVSVKVPATSVVVDERGRVLDLVCPGATGCEHANGQFEVGVSKRDVTPDLSKQPVWMAGFNLGRQATEVHDPIWVRALSFSRGNTRIGWVVLDVIGYFHDEVLRVRRGAVELGFDHVMVATTHNHEANDTMGIWGADFATSGYDPLYMEWLVEQVIAALAEARANEQPASMTVALAQAPEFVADSRVPVVIDQNIYSFAFANPQSQVFATMVIWGNHPEALGGRNTALTSDFAHYLRETMEAAYPQSTCVYMSGILGGLTTPLRIPGCPDENGDATCANGTFEKAEYVGVGAATQIIAALAEEATVVDDNPSLKLSRHSFLIHSTNLGMVLAFKLGLYQRGVVGPDGVLIAPADLVNFSDNDFLDGKLQLQSEVNGLQLGSVQILTVPGELYAELWMEPSDGGTFVEVPDGADFPDAPIEPSLQNLMPAASIRAILNQGNDALGYIIPKTQWDEDEPRAYKPDGQYGEQNSTGYNTAPTLREAVEALYRLD